jgi:hypothetical protein
MELIGECKGNNGNGCFMDSCGHDCGCFTIQERMYSEEDVLDILYKHTEDLLAGKKLTLEEWFEQFKKK